MNSEDAAKEPDVESYVNGVVQSIQLWQSREPSVVATLLGKAGVPVAYLVRRLIPMSALRGVLLGLDSLAKIDFNRDAEATFEDLRICDNQVNKVRVLYSSIAATEGGVTGYIGLPGLIVDIPAIITLALRTVRQIGACYGYADDTDSERLFVFSVLSAAGANTQVEKVEALGTAAVLMNALSKQTWKAIAEKSTTQKVGIEASITVVRALAKQLGITLTKRKALAAIPFIGAVVGAGTNAWFLKDVGESAQRVFQERWLRDRGRFRVGGHFGLSGRF